MQLSNEKNLGTSCPEWLDSPDLAQKYKGTRGVNVYDDLTIASSSNNNEKTTEIRRLSIEPKAAPAPTKKRPASAEAPADGKPLPKPKVKKLEHITVKIEQMSADLQTLIDESKSYGADKLLPVLPAQATTGKAEIDALAAEFHLVKENNKDMNLDDLCSRGEQALINMEDIYKKLLEAFLD